MNCSSRLRCFLYLTAAVSGAAVMILEILGVRMLAPYMGTSHFIWTAQILVTLFSLAAGYYLGGWMADRWPRPTPLFAVLLAAALYLCFSLLKYSEVAFFCATKLNLPLGSVLASGFLFFIPLMFLATTGPFLTRLLAGPLEGAGTQVGKVIAIGTLGSLMGTLFISYVAIPYLPLSWTLLLTSAMICTLSLTFFLFSAGSISKKATLGLSLLAPLLLGTYAARKDLHPHYAFARELERTNSAYGLLQVFEAHSDKNIYLLNDFLVENSYNPHTKQASGPFSYLLTLIAREHTLKINDVLCIGLGAGMVPREFVRQGARVQVAEINPKVAPLAAKYFDLDLSTLQLFDCDGRVFLSQSQQTFDVIILDAALGDVCPWHLITRESFRTTAEHLRPGGSFLINYFIEGDVRKDFAVASIQRTLQSVFAHVWIHATGESECIFVASNDDSFRRLSDREVDEANPSHRNLIEIALNPLPNLKSDAEKGIILTDDYNPIEFHRAAFLQSIRRKFVGAMKTL